MPRALISIPAFGMCFVCVLKTGAMRGFPKRPLPFWLRGGKLLWQKQVMGDVGDGAPVYLEQTRTQALPELFSHFCSLRSSSAWLLLAFPSPGMGRWLWPAPRFSLFSLTTIPNPESQSPEERSSTDREPEVYSIMWNSLF